MLTLHQPETLIDPPIEEERPVIVMPDREPSVDDWMAFEAVCARILAHAALEALHG